jgi:hypothetical protein
MTYDNQKTKELNPINQEFKDFRISKKEYDKQRYLEKKGKYNKVEVGYIGETYVLHQLAKYKTSAIFSPITFDFDILTEDNIRIEVKTARLMTGKKKYFSKKKDILELKESSRWQFANQSRKYDGVIYKHKSSWVRYKFSKRDRNCDFFVFVCMDENYNIVRTYIIPKEIIGNREIIVIPYKNDNYLTEYYDKWELIVGDRIDGI